MVKKWIQYLCKYFFVRLTTPPKVSVKRTRHFSGRDSYSIHKIKRRLKRFLNKSPHSEASVIVMLKSFPIWYEEGIMRDMAIETLILLWNQYYKELLAVQEHKSCSSLVLAYRKAITTYVHRVLAAKREAEK